MKKKKILKLLGEGFLIFIITFLIVKLMNAVSYKILLSKHLISSAQFSRCAPDLNVWEGGFSNSREGFFFQGYNDSLAPGGMIYGDQYGFIHGDSLPLPPKDSSITRIVLTGGSGMYGSLQTWSIVKKFNYPQGTYDYETSIAGKLKKNLQRQYPGKRFEVINAAVVMHTFAQSYAMYFEKIRDTHPDIVINMDGYNDDYLATDFELEGDPYRAVYNQKTQGLDLEVLRRVSSFGYTAMLISYYILGGERDEYISQISLKDISDRVSLSDIKYLIKNFNKGVIDTYPMMKDSFRFIEPLLKKNIEKQLWLINSWEKQLKNDGVHSIFCFQPILAREGSQKPLSDKEKELKSFLDQDGPLDHFAYDSVTMKIENLPEEIQSAMKKSGDARCHIKNYYHKVFINDYISPAIDSIVTAQGGDYIDLGKKMIGLPSWFEFFMDYCHTTPKANAFIADQVTQKVVSYLENASKK